MNRLPRSSPGIGHPAAPRRPVGAGSSALRWLVWPVLFCVGCTGAPNGLDPVEGFETDRYLGTWYEIARFDHSFERGLEDVSATYTRREDGGLRVRNRGYDPEQEEWREAIGRAYPLKDPSVASMKVSFFGPFYGGYHVIALDRDRYDAALIVGPTREYLWILARERSLAPERREELLAIARAAALDVDELIWVAQTRDDPELLR